MILLRAMHHDIREEIHHAGVSEQAEWDTKHEVHVAVRGPLQQRFWSVNNAVQRAVNWELQ